MSTPYVSKDAAVKAFVNVQAAYEQEKERRELLEGALNAAGNLWRKQRLVMRVGFPAAFIVGFAVAVVIGWWVG